MEVLAVSLPARGMCRGARSKSSDRDFLTTTRQRAPRRETDWDCASTLARSCSAIAVRRRAPSGGARSGGQLPADRAIPAADGAHGVLPWRFRATWCALAGHVNHTAYVTPREEEPLEDG
jgi:hypothetical protein